MKQVDVIIGEKYLFKKTNTIVTVKSVTEGKPKPNEYYRNRRYKRPNSYLLSNGIKTNAGQLKSITNIELK